MPPVTVINASGLTKSYNGHVVVDNVDLEIQRGECFGLLGPNGAGKTTTLRMLLGMTPADGGTLTVLDHPVPTEARQMRRRLGVVPQQDSLDPDFSVAENLRTYATYFGLSGPQIEQRIGELVTFASLEQRSDARIDQLSGGMKRRLTLARALINEPELIILDEPTTGLDPQARQVIWQRLRSLLNGGRTLILTTHYMEEAYRLCDRLAIMDQGHILDIDTPKALIERHIETHVVEVHGPGLHDWFTSHGQALALRTEQAGETLFCYTDDEKPLLESLHQSAQVNYISRTADLEDVFLKLTGRDLRE